MDSSKTVGIFFRSDGVDRSLVIAMWWRTLVIRGDMGSNEPFFIRNGSARTFAAFGIRILWRK